MQLTKHILRRISAPCNRHLEPARCRSRAYEMKTRSTSEKGPMPSFDIDVTRDGGWWAVHIPELGGLTQARYPSEVEPMAREYIAVSTGTSVDQVAINWRRCTLQPR